MAGTGELLVKLLLSSQGFDNGIKKSKQKVSDFEKAGQEMGKKIVTSFGQIAGAMMAIKGAGDAFNAVINSSQTIGDAFASTMATAKTVTDNFIYSLANADFSTFNNGLDDMTSKAREAHAAMDQLGNTRMAASFVTSSNEADFKRYMTRARDKSLSVEERQEWLNKAGEPLANIIEAQETLKRDTMDAIKAEIAKKTGLDASNISEEIIRQTFSLNAKETNKEENERILSEYAAFKEKQKAIIAPLKALEMKATSSAMGVKAQLEASAQLPAAQEKASAALQQLTKENERLIIEYTLLGRESDEGLQNLMNLVSSADAAENKISEMISSKNEVVASLENQAKGVATATQKLHQERVALEQEQQALYKAVSYGGPVTTMQMGVKFDNSDISIDARNKALISGKPIAQYRQADPLADMPKQVAKLDESALPAMSFGSDDQTENFVSNMDMMTEGVGGLINAYSTLGSVISGDNQEMQALIQTTAQMAQAIIGLVAQIVAETAARKASKTEATGEAAAKAMSAHAGIPFAGIAAGIAAVASIIATISSLPKFAEGGIVTSATLGVFGEAGPEAVMPLDRLNDFVRDREVRVTGKIVGQGKDLSVIIDNYNKVRAVK